MAELTQFSRTTCSCPKCQVYCQVSPGRLAPSDLAKLAGSENVFEWAEKHLRAVIDTPYPKLIPISQSSGHCHWYINGSCSVHDRSPFGCAYFDSHMAGDEVRLRSQALTQACLTDAKNNGIYFQVWNHLRFKGLITKSSSKQAVAEAMARVESAMNDAK